MCLSSFIIIIIIVWVYYDKYSYNLYEQVQTVTLICIKDTFGNQIIWSSLRVKNYQKRPTWWHDNSRKNINVFKWAKNTFFVIRRLSKVKKFFFVKMSTWSRDHLRKNFFVSKWAKTLFFVIRRINKTKKVFSSKMVPGLTPYLKI